MAASLIVELPQRDRINGVGPMVSLLTSTLLLIVTCAAQEWYLRAALQHLGLAVVATSVACVSVVVVQYRRHLWAFAPMLLFLIVVFHVGFFAGPLLTGRFQFLTGSSTAWATTNEMRMAAWYVAACICAFAAGATVFRLAAGPEKSRELDDDGFAHAAARVGVIVLAFSVVAWFITVLSVFGLHAFSISYLDFFAATRSSAVAYANLGIALGVVLVSVDPSSRSARAGLVIFGVFALVSLSIGARSTTMFAAAAAMVILGYRRAMPRAALMAPIVVGVATVFGLVRLTRLYGLTGLHARDVLLSPLTGFAELGYTIRVVQTSFLWHGVMQEPVRSGATYLGWPARLVQEYLLGHTLPPDDFRLMNVEIGSRIGGLGGSILAEAHHNFGVVGGVIIAFALGLTAAWASRSVRTTVGLALLGVVVVPLFIHVRNSFAPFLFTVLCGLVLVGVARIIQSSDHISRS